MPGLLSGLGNAFSGLKGLLGEDALPRILAARAISDGDYQGGARLLALGEQSKLARQEAQREAQERFGKTMQEVDAISALEQSGATPEEIAIARMNMPEFSKRYVERYGTQTVSPGSSVMTGEVGGKRTIWTAPRSDVINNDIVSTDLNTGTSRKVYDGPAPTKSIGPGSSLVNEETGQSLFQSDYKPEVVSGPDGARFVFNPGSPNTTPRGVRNNNFGNIKDGPFARSMPGYKGSDGTFAVFDSPEAGRNAATQLLTRYMSNGSRSVASIVSKWAPVSENGGASTANYIKHVAARLGVKPGEALDYDQIPDIISAMSEFENGGRGGTGRSSSVTTIVPPTRRVSANQEAKLRGEAEEAISRGADPAKVKARLAQMLGES